MGPVNLSNTSYSLTVTKIISSPSRNEAFCFCTASSCPHTGYDDIIRIVIELKYKRENKEIGRCCRYVKLPAYYIATDAVFLNLMNELVDSINGMPDAVGLDSWKNGLKNVIDLFEDVVEYVP